MLTQIQMEAPCYVGGGGSLIDDIQVNETQWDVIGRIVASRLQRVSSGISILNQCDDNIRNKHNRCVLYRGVCGL